LILLTSESPLTLGAFVWVISLGWICILLQQTKLRHAIKTALFVLLLVAQLAPLFYFKYWNFVLNECLGLDLRIPSVLIPMGLSFYTFQTIGFWIDNLRNPKPRPTLLDYLNFCSFFPQIVAGPIEKRESLLPQIEQVDFKVHKANLESALQWIILGLAYKLIVADNLGNLSDKFTVDPHNAWHIWLECLVFGIRIYFDFAGYSFIAIGLGLLFGVHLTLNFRCPYWSADLREFWRNWHITLGAWLRDYIYLPLGGNRVRWVGLNVLIVFLVSGIWHGAGWGFLIWGLMHGIGIIACSRKRPLIPFKPLRIAVTFAYSIVIWLFFFERDTSLMFTKALSLLHPLTYAPSHLLAIPRMFPGISDLVTVGFILILSLAALALEGLDIRWKQEPYHILRRPWASYTLIFLIVLLAPMEESSFIYFNF
ncbi:MAG: MBOAT family O-acyltransferase, partial [Verrucomicrobiales bacterium]